MNASFGWTRHRPAAVLALAAGWAAALAWVGDAQAQIDAAKSTLVAVSRQMNVPVEGRFTKFDAQIAFDPAKPQAGTARITVDTGSYDLGDASYNDSIRGPEWFDAKTWPQATFVSTSVAPTGPNQFRVNGNLTIKGHAEAVAVPIVLTQQGTTQMFDGTLPIHRLAFNVGTGEWKDTSTVADEVVIKFHIVVAHK
ncbi:MAG: YceI family protein [Paraburkholderia sp.]|uniref:YceI family protein n=1 Tax=Paraburkholderia sp. TaxID=1926495 RepID=UPI0012108727|nr:YceI family protein [Paraburkholderia sp.]TAM08123.1 MAG: YceI family protein [Paraburkholderia sp.]TAM31733.1 MAG: YceI family protein [Paraburkholderia sp.]